MSELPPQDPLSPVSGTPTASGGATIPPGTTATTGEPGDAEKNKLMAVLAYLGILVLIPIFVAKESPFARYHSNQGLVLLIVSVVGMFVLGVATAMVGLIPFLRACACLMLPVMMVYWLGIVVLAILGIVNAVKGKMAPLPVIGKYKILK